MSAPVDALALVAVVGSGGRELLVLNRRLRFTYEPDGHNGYVGTDGPFRDVLGYSRGGGRFVAFAGREFTIPLVNGATATLKDHWWQGHIKGFSSAAYGDVESLKKCYVFSGGACISPDELAALRATYTGCVYPYWDYEKVIKFDDFRKDMYRRVFHEEKRRKALTNAVKQKHRELLSCRSIAQGATP